MRGLSARITMSHESLKLCLLVSGAHPRLAAQEAEALLGRPVTELSDRLYTVDVESDEELKLTLQKLYNSILLKEAVIVKAVSFDQFPEKSFYKSLAASQRWEEVRGRAFAVVVRKLERYPPISSVELAAIVAEGVTEALRGDCRVDLETPDVTISLITSRKIVVLGLQALKVRGDRYRLRSKKFKIFKHPASLTPEDAGILVNLTGWRSPLLDPFCGSGTIVIEACLRGLEAVGLDIDLNAARGAHLNLKLFSCGARGHVVVGDATQPPFRERAFRSVAANPPYGRILKNSPQRLVQSLLGEGTRAVTDDAVLALVLPSPFNVSEDDYHVAAHPVRVHGKLTRFFTRVWR